MRRPHHAGPRDTSLASCWSASDLQDGDAGVELESVCTTQRRVKLKFHGTIQTDSLSEAGQLAESEVVTPKSRLKLVVRPPATNF